MELLDKIKILTGIKTNDYDEILEIYIEMVEEEIFDYCGEVAIPENLVVQMVNIKFQRRGTEALSNTNYSGNGEVYLNDYPANILRRLEDLKDKSKRRLRTL